MVLSFPFSYGFGVLSVLGSLLSVSSSDWLGVWFGLEVNLLGFIPLMIQGVSGQAVESAVKYFIVQALGSSFLLLGGFSGGGWEVCWFMFDFFYFPFFMCFFGLILKLGVAPLHWWVPSVMGGLGWFGCGFLMTWQKLAPFLVVASLNSFFFPFFVFFGCFSSLLGGLMGVGQVQTRILMAYSSISHWGWIIGVLGYSFMGSLSYFFFYFLISLFLFYFLGCGGLWRSSQVGGLGGLFVMVGFLSLGGLPPLSGFVSKWIGLQVISGGGGFLLLVFLILGSLLALYYYLSFLFLFFLSGGWGYKIFYMEFSCFWVSVGVFVLVLGLPFYEVFFYIFS